MRTISEQIIKLWNKEELPMLNGVLKQDGTFYKYNEEILSDLNPFIDFYTSTVDIIVRKEFDNYIIYGGEGSHGSDGWILLLTADHDFVWLISGTFNPIMRIEIDNDQVSAYNNGDVKISFNIETPEIIEVTGNLYLSDDLIRDY